MKRENEKLNDYNNTGILMMVCPKFTNSICQKQYIVKHFSFSAEGIRETFNVYIKNFDKERCYCRICER